MTKTQHISFPASHLSAHEVGRRIQVITKDGAKIADTLTGLSVKLDGGKARIFLRFANVGLHDSYGNGDFEVLPEQFVKRIEGDGE